jgi:2-polyprenyl-3-methyl-5-hydroxy-6-metoxy-1,4-benzoquinol methylase
MKCKICGGRLVRWYSGLFDDRHGYPGKFDVKKCKRCNFGQTFPQLSASKIAAIYSKYYPWNKTDVSKIKRQDFVMPDKFKLWRKGLFINGQYSVRPKTKVLDVGCGLGHSLLELESIGCKAYGVDPDKNALKLSKKFKLNFKVGFIEKKPFPKESFDYIIANQVLEHTNNPISFLKTIKTRLNPDGQIILSFPNVNSLTRYVLKQNWLHWHIPYHLNFFTRESIKILAEKSGLKIVSLRTETPNMWTNLQIRRSLQNPKIGQRDLFWDGKPNSDEKYNVGILQKIVRFLEEYNFINRAIDYTGYGESFVLTLSKA